MSDAPNSGKVRAEALRIAESGKPPTSHATYPTKAVSEDESRRRAVFQYAAGITRGRTVTAEQVEAAAEAVHDAIAPEDGEGPTCWWHEPSKYVRKLSRHDMRVAFRAAGFLVEGDDDEHP